MFLLLFFIFSACENSLKEVEEVTEQYKSPVETLKEVNLYYSEEAHVKVNIQAPLLLRHKTKEPFYEFTEGVTVIFYDEDLKTTGKLTANYGIMKEKEQMTIVKDNVVWISLEKKQKLETEELVWDQKAHKITSDKFVKITTETESIFGEGFEAKQDFSKYKILKTTGTVKVKSDEFMKPSS